jgi:hypothetical protein
MENINFIYKDGKITSIMVDGVEYAPIEKKETKFKLGQEYLGGIIFHVDESGEHGLVAAKIDYFERIDWNDAMKTFPIGDWRLPTKKELNLLYEQREIVGGFATGRYWSSSEYDNSYAWIQNFSSGSQDNYGYQNYAYYVRAVRAF